MALKPTDIINHKLPRKMFGVDPEALQAFLAQIAAALQKTNDELTRALIDRGQLQQSLKKATATIAELEQQIANMPTNAATSQTIAGIRASAKEILDAARTNAAETMKSAQKEGEETIIAAKAAAEEILQAARTDAAEALRAAKAQADETLTMAKAAAETLGTVETQAEETITAAKTASEEILQAARADAAELIRTAETQAQEKIAMATAAAATLGTFKEQTDEMIAGVRAAAEQILHQARKSAAETLKAARKQAKEMVQVAENPAAAQLAKLHAEAEQAELHVTGLAPKVESLVREIQGETLPRLTGLLRQLKQQDITPGSEPPPGATRHTGEVEIEAAPRIKTVGVVDFYAPIPLGASEGVTFERFAADDAADLLTRAAGDKLAVITRAVMQQAQTAMRWRDEDVLGSERLSTLARTVRADWLIVGLIPMLNIESRDRRFTGEALVVIRIFDATHGRVVAETRKWGSKAGDTRARLAEQVLHKVLESTIASVISTLTA